MAVIRLTLLAFTTFAAALAAGFFYAYACSVMPGLEDSDPVAAITTMQGINRVVRNPVFAFSFFGALGFGLLAALSYGRALTRAKLTWGGVALYAVGVFAVTFLRNVPLNEALALIEPDPATAARVWGDYAAPWIIWNWVRTGFSLAAFACFLAALIGEAAQLPRQSEENGPSRAPVSP